MTGASRRAQRKGRARFANIPEAIFARAAHELTPGEFLVLAAILLCLNWRRGEAWPTVGRLAEISGLSRDTVTRAKTILQERGYINCGWRDVKGGGHLIRVLFDMDGNRREFPTRTTRETRPKPPGNSDINHRENSGTLPTRQDAHSEVHHSQEHRQGTHPAIGDPFAIIECPHLRNGKERMLLGEAYEAFRASATGKALLTGRNATALWGSIKRAVGAYHDDRRHRGLACDYEGCIRLPAAKIVRMRGAKANPLGYLEQSLAGALGGEEDRAQQARAAKGRGSRGVGFAPPREFLKALPPCPESRAPGVSA